MPPLPGKRNIRFHGLKRPKIRADMKKENLYNLARARAPPTATRTYFQQKWTAKSISRAYHGEYVREGQWTRMFSRVSQAVVPMNPYYLAQHDGSDESAGRGSGRTPPPSAPGAKPKPRPKTPYMQMVYHPMERRLDMAIFRALFASSAKQARQYVTHGAVKVNGKEMRFPGYMLNPGDMFQVDTERVMFATGAKKGTVAERERRRLAKPKTTDPESTTSEEAVEVEASAPPPTEAVEEPSEDDLALQITAEEEADIADDDPAATTKKTLKTLLQRTRSIVADPKRKATMSSKQKQDWRALLKTLRPALSRASTTTPSALEDLEAQFAALSARTDTGTAPTAREADLEAADKAAADAAMEAALARARENPIDPSKPYATPWRPREWMSAFAFIPRYLEVNQNICSAVYLRHPVVTPGLAEVPTPFSPQTGQLAFNWYLRRR